ncbi:hypothetical protein KBTX_02193 [wastewater metagenome]|uniref:HIRAN domain-containing protein n=2 Tax=unclassified sequences TaxID=12908 RepID=A0A5B8RG91_9ZZZZ|nr:MULTISPECIES: HIRAN domain-containing protein [Arhodomonas]MCS4505186.1 HIRAN domain-containing protein [Arhodomonas aquaeolei]QEA05865.1 hypothetical protein KBTEX_02193 [uncultured organism]
MITRRNLLQALAAVPLAGTAGLVSGRSPKGITIQRSSLAGFQFHEGETVWASLRIGQPLALIREPDNPHDSRAVRVEWRGRKLGYIPRRDNTAISQMLDRGERLEARIIELQASRSPWQRVQLEVGIPTST